MIDIQSRETKNNVNYIECCIERWLDAWVYINDISDLQFIDEKIVEESLAFYEKMIKLKKWNQSKWIAMPRYIILNTLKAMEWRPNNETKMSWLLFASNIQEIKEALAAHRWRPNPFQYLLRKHFWLHVVWKSILDIAYPDQPWFNQIRVNNWTEEKMNYDVVGVRYVKTKRVWYMYGWWFITEINWPQEILSVNLDKYSPYIWKLLLDWTLEDWILENQILIKNILVSKHYINE